MTPFERGFMTSYRHSIVTFSLSLPVSRILPFLCASAPIFSHPTSSLPKISPRSLWGPKREGVGLIVRAISLQDFQRICGTDPPTSRTDGQTVTKQSQYRAICTCVNEINRPTRIGVVFGFLAFKPQNRQFSHDIAARFISRTACSTLPIC